MCVYALDLNATIERLRAGTSGSRFETVDFRSDAVRGCIGGGTVPLSSSDVKNSTSPYGKVDDDDDEDDIAAAVERAKLDSNAQQTAATMSWDMVESSP